jgi:hypothetical protein
VNDQCFHASLSVHTLMTLLNKILSW